MTTSTLPSGLTVDAHGVERAEPAFFDEHGDAGADHLAVGAALLQLALQGRPVGKRERLVEQQRVVAGVVDNMGAERIELQIVGHRAFGDQIAAADFDAVDADLWRRWRRAAARARRSIHSGPARDRCRTASCWSAGYGRWRDRPARDRAPAAWRRRDRARWRHGCAYRRRCRGRIRRRWRGYGRRRRWRRARDGSAGANDWRRSDVRAGPRSI